MDLDLAQLLAGDARADGSDAIRVGDIDGVFSFLSHVDWSERWLQVLIAFHILCFVLIILTRFYTNIQAFLFVGLLAIVFFAESINEFAALNYKYFSRLQYFDSGGLFISLVVCLPILMNCFIMLLFWLYGAGTMLVKVKKAKLRKDAAARKNAGETKEGEEKEPDEDETKKKK